MANTPWFLVDLRTSSLGLQAAFDEGHRVLVGVGPREDQSAIGAKVQTEAALRGQDVRVVDISDLAESNGDVRSECIRRLEKRDCPALVLGIAHWDSMLGLLLREILVGLPDRAEGPTVSSVPSAPESRETTASWVVARDGSWFQKPDGTIVSLGRRRAGARILAALTAERVRDPGDPLDTDRLIAVGWPNERARRSSLHNRLYVTLVDLRRLGLGDRLVHRPGGYRLETNARFEGELSRTA